MQGHVRIPYRLHLVAEAVEAGNLWPSVVHAALQSPQPASHGMPVSHAFRTTAW